MQTEVYDQSGPTPAHDLTARVRTAAEFLTEAGWTQGTERDDDGHVCLTGAIRYCAPQTGDEYLIRGVLRVRKRAEEWNDAKGRTADEVIGYLRSAEITDGDLAATFGPQWVAIVELVRRSATLTDDEAQRMAAAWDATWAAARDATRAAAWAAAWAAARAATRDATRDATWAATRDAARDAARDATRAAAWAAARAAAWDAARALVARDLITDDGFTADHYRTLAGPWTSVCGPVHPDDQRDGLCAEATR